MSKTTDKIKSLLAEYEGRHPGALKLKPRTNKAHADIAAIVKSQRAVASTVQPQSTQKDPVSSAPRRRAPPGLMWTTVENIPVLKALDAGYQNYAAVTNVKPAGTYTIYKLDPRKAISYRCLAKDIHHYIAQDLKHEATQRENLAFTKRQEETRAEAEERSFLDQPGFYIVPGETVGPDDRIYNASGPYLRFETAGFNPDFTWLRGHANEMDIDPNFNDVEDDALETARSLPSTHVKIIEARNPVEAAAGNGHVWCQDGLFRGPPVDPRQSGFRW
jgi:hypothetical protein